MRERLRCYLPDAPGITVATFHSFALDLLRRFPVEAGFRADVAAALAAANLPTSYLGHFFLRPEIKDMLAVLEMCLGLDGSPLLRLNQWPEYALPEQRDKEVLPGSAGAGSAVSKGARASTRTTTTTRARPGTAGSIAVSGCPPGQSWSRSRPTTRMASWRSACPC